LEGQFYILQSQPHNGVEMSGMRDSIVLQPCYWRSQYSGKI